MRSFSIKKSDWVQCAKSGPDSHIGFVRRVSRKHGWADVDWGQWTKRMPLSSLRVEHTIPICGGTATDITRKAELQGEA